MHSLWHLICTQFSAVAKKIEFGAIWDKFASYLVQIYIESKLKKCVGTAKGAIWDEFSEHQKNTLFNAQTTLFGANTV